MAMTLSGRPLAGLGLVLAGCLWAAAVQAEDPAANDGTNATYWMQNSVEYKANSAALYALAKLRLDQALADPKWTAALEQGAGYENKPPAVILDLDETVLDNSEYQAWIVENGQHYSSKTWAVFVGTQTSRAVPGSLDFVKYANSKGVAVFYVSNRKGPTEAPTRENMAKLGYPIGDKEDMVLLRGEKEAWGSDKGSRRAVVAAKYRILLQIGDNLGDFIDDVDVSEAERVKLYQANAARWGHDWIMLANPSYGSWEGASFGFNWKAPSGEKRRMKYDTMVDWRPAQ